MDSKPVLSKAGSRETLWAIIGSFVLSIVLASVLAGNPFRALGAAYFDYDHEPGGSGAKAAPASASVAPTAPK